MRNNYKTYGCIICGLFNCMFYEIVNVLNTQYNIDSAICSSELFYIFPIHMDMIFES